MRAANILLRFILEVTAIVILAAVAVTGDATVPSRIAGGVGAAAFVLVWGRFIGPRAPHRLDDPVRLIVEVALFTGAAVAFGVVVNLGAAIAFATVVVVNEGLLFAFQQRDR
ncbi:MAG TPA: YrdB family protein [Actinomycetota bacterium]|nr:YrdB family protein [Actinomycetota bacterium]